MKPSHQALPAALFLITVAFTVNAGATGWVDAVSFTYGQDEDSNEVEVFRIGLQNRWERTWFKGGAWYLGGYWDAELAYMDSDVKKGDNHELFDISLTPVFRYQRDANLSSGVTPYAEAGIGPHLISDTELGFQKYSTAFQFGSLVGFGLGFGGNGQYEIAYRFQHISNANIKKPNDGMNLHLLRLGYSFY